MREYQRLLGAGASANGRESAATYIGPQDILWRHARSLAALGVWMAGTSDGDPLVWSQECYEIFGVAIGTELRVHQFFSLVLPDDVESLRNARNDAVERDVPYEIQYRIKHPSGPVRWIHERAALVQTGDGRTATFMGVLQDATEQRESERALRRAEASLRFTEEQLRHAQKMEAVGRLAGGIAHDFNNVLSVILSYSQLLLSELPPNQPFREDILEIQKAGELGAQLTRQLLAFSRPPKVEPKVLDVNCLLMGMEKMISRVLGEDIELISVLASPAPRVKADSGLLEQVVMNLVVNARDAMSRGGRLVLETATMALGDLERQGLPAGQYVVLTVSDSGTGMDLATQSRIFEPFFTTKEPGIGTGLGLSIVFGIVKQSGGSIVVNSVLGSGTSFTIYLPRVDAVGEAKPVVTIPRRSGGTETVLIVEDEDHVRNAASGVLRRMGYQVLAARSPGDALLLCERHPKKIDLLLTDVTMPQMSGIELATRLVALQPGLKVLCMSGSSPEPTARTEVAPSRFPFLQKPITLETLTKKVREVLDAPLDSGPRSTAREAWLASAG
jgi:PAS domain S-box-containing protein